MATIPDRLEPKLVQAVDADNVVEAAVIVEQAKARGQCTDRVLALGLNRACDRNLVDCAQLLLSHGAKPNYSSGNKLPGLLRASENGFAEIAELLVRSGANVEARDKNGRTALLIAAHEGHHDVVAKLINFRAKIEHRNLKGRTALMTSAWRGHLHVVRLLLAEGAQIDAVDNNQRNVLHNLAADKGELDSSTPGNVRPRRRCGADVFKHLLQAGVDIEAKDKLGRTPLHWTCVTDHEELMRILLVTRFGGASSKAMVDAREQRDKTPLHLAAIHNREHLAKILLEHGAHVNAKSDGGWTALHNACTQGSAGLVQVLLDAGANINSELLTGRTPLHIAAESGNTKAAQCLLKPENGCKRSVKDRFGNTPLLMAAQYNERDKKDVRQRKKAILEMLAPWNHLGDLSQDELEAAKQFRATIVDFGDFPNGNRVSRESIHDLLYERVGPNQSKHAISTLRDKGKAIKFSWIHLPANNIAWCEALITKRFIEEGAVDLEGYKALELSFNHQHKGEKDHSRFMRPMCQVTRRNDRDGSDHRTTDKVVSPITLPTIPNPHLLTSVPETRVEPPTKTQNAMSGQYAALEPQSPLPTLGKVDAPETRPMNRQDTSTSESSATAKRSGRPKTPRIQRQETSSTIATSETSGSSKQHVKYPRSSRKEIQRKESRAGIPNHDKSTPGEPPPQLPCNIFMFMPFLHFEEDSRRKQMQSALERPDSLRRLGVLAQADEILIRAHHDRSGSFLHIRRTLDQFFYHNIDTHVRDSDQVVYRFQKIRRQAKDPKVYMVDQLWMFVLGKDLVVTCFWQRWHQPRNDPLNVLDGIIEDINSKTREPVQNVYEVAIAIAGRCFGPFDRHRKGDLDFQFLDMFESSIGLAMNHEATLFQEFSKASLQASDWLRTHQRREPEFVDKLLDVGAETSLLAEIKDIRDELDILAMILNQQKHVLPELKKAIKGVYIDDRSLGSLRKVDLAFEEQEKTIGNPLKDIYRMDKQAHRIYESIRDLLDLKQKHANAFEARFARDQAQGTRRQGQTIMVFTIVTVVFLPLSFIASFFAINVDSFPHNPATGNPSMSLGYVSQFIFGIGLAISIPCIALALSVGELSEVAGKVKRGLPGRWRRLKSHSEDSDSSLNEQTITMGSALSLAKSFRPSIEDAGGPGSLARRSVGSPYEGLHARTRQYIWDVETGKQSALSG